MCSLSNPKNFWLLLFQFKPFVRSEEAIEHTHHFVIYKCETPDHNNTIFERYVGDRGGECYGEKEMSERPTQFCKNILYDWGAGGKVTIFFNCHVKNINISN